MKNYELTVTSSFTLRLVIFEKGACHQSAFFPQTTLCLRILSLENRSKPAFKLCGILECPNESLFHSYITITHYIEKYKALANTLKKMKDVAGNETRYKFCVINYLGAT